MAKRAKRLQRQQNKKKREKNKTLKQALKQVTPNQIKPKENRARENLN